MTDLDSLVFTRGQWIEYLDGSLNEASSQTDDYTVTIGQIVRDLQEILRHA